MTKKQLLYFDMYRRYNTLVLRNMLQDFENEINCLKNSLNINFAKINNLSERIFVVQEIVKSRKGH